MGVLRVRARACLGAVCVMGALGGWAGVANAVQLPDGRAYEMVSPPDKNGGDVMASSARVRSATDGLANAYASLTPSGDVVGTGVGSEYMSIRTREPGTRGWTTHAISPPQPPLTYALLLLGVETLYQGDFSTDLNDGVVRAWSPLTDAPNVATVDNLYLRDDLRSVGRGSYHLVSDCPVCTVPLGSALAGSGISPLAAYGVPHVGDASTDFRHVLFTSIAPLAAGGSDFSPNAYEWDNGVVRLAGVLPDGTPAPSSVAGGDFDFVGSFQAQRSISADGSKVFFGAPADSSSANLYMRVDGSSTVQLNASERASADSPQPAVFWDASDDGSRVFFTTKEALTDDAPVNGDQKVYVYDTTKPADDPHNLTYVSVDRELADIGDDAQAVIGASADGSTVYFVSQGQLVAGRPLVGLGIYAWHDGVVSFVSATSGFDIPELSLESNAFNQAQVAADGDLLFSSSAQGGRELYLYRLATGRLSCASCGPGGPSGSGDATVVVQRGEGGSQRLTRKTRAITDDGEHVFFSTSKALVPEDRNNAIDAYEYDAASDSVHLISSGQDPSPSYVMDATPGGHDVFFVTRERLVGWDVDGNYDMYDARVGGGFPDPPPVASQCSGDPCQGLPAPPPDGAGVSSSLFSGRGDEPGSLHTQKAKRKRCRRGHVRRKVHGHVRCVRRTPKHSRHQTAGSARREGQRRSR